MTFHPDTLPDLTGKVYIVTGGTSGMYVLQFIGLFDPLLIFAEATTQSLV